MKEESIFHIKVNYDEAVESKKDILSSERDFLNVLRILKRYDLLRREELTNKLRIQNKIRDLKANLTRINNILPKIKLPDILKKKNEPEKEEIEEVKAIKTPIKVREHTDEDDLERQLREIQEKLSKLG
ncbi:MAG: hypothetical protein ACP5NZ_03420 [Nanobdellota archaeon]